MLEAVVGSEFTLTACWFLVYYLNGTDPELGDSRLVYAIFFFLLCPLIGICLSGMLFLFTHV